MRRIIGMRRYWALRSILNDEICSPWDGPHLALGAPDTDRERRALDPALHHARAACDKDFSQQCPLLFSPAGAGKCAPTAAYSGPCSGSVQSFDGLSPSAKERWSELRAAYWPCVECRRDYSSLCPGGWASTGGTTCKPTASYIGPCASAVNFAGFNRGAMAEWSSTCGAYWPCLA